VKAGLVGFKGAGKSVLFDALAGGRSSGGVDLVSTRVSSVVHERDARFLALADLYQPKKLSPLSFELHDFPGIAPPGSREAGFKPALVRDEVQALVLVLRGFTTDAYHYPRAAADPAVDARDLVSELLIEDLAAATRRVEKLQIAVTKPTPRQDEEKRNLAVMLRIREQLEQEVPVKEMDLSPDEKRSLRGFGFLSAKPWFLLVSGPDEGPQPDLSSLEGPFEGRAFLRTKLEAELLELEEDERAVFMDDLGVEELVLPDLLDHLLSGLGMMRFYTVGPTEVHVWEVEQGASAVTAAGKIHSDLARGFIRAEVVAYDDLMGAGDMRAAKAAGTVRLEGRDYVVKDGDILDIRFSI
jgi:ribosome-binding ATPase